MSFDQLRYFVAVADAGTTRQAARNLHVSQPPLSRQIHALEHELGTRLFERTSSGMSLKPAGALLLLRARSILNSVESAIAQVEQLTGSTRSSCLAASAEVQPGSASPATHASRC